MSTISCDIALLCGPFLIDSNINHTVVRVKFPSNIKVHVSQLIYLFPSALCPPRLQLLHHPVSSMTHGLHCSADAGRVWIQRVNALRSVAECPAATSCMCPWSGISMRHTRIYLVSFL